MPSFTMGPRSASYLALLILAACSSEVARRNPLDPSGTGPKAPGRIRGAVYVQGQSGELFPVLIYDELEARVDGDLMTQPDGTFVSPELEPAVYRLEVSVPITHVPIRVDDIELLPGEEHDVGLLTALLEPPTGVIVGNVSLEDPTLAPDSIRVVASHLVGSVLETRVTYTDATGAYSFTSLGAGDYELRADRSGFTPDLVPSVVVNGAARQSASAPDMKLYPASAVIRFSVTRPLPGGGTEVIDGSPYTRDPDVDLLALAFGGVNRMRFAETLAELEAVAWRDHVVTSALTLSAGEGVKQIYAQFAVVDADSRERLRTETYQTSIIYDATPPVPLSVVLAPGARVIAGERYFSGDLTSVPLEVVALDPYSFVAGVKVVIEDADPLLESYDLRGATSPTLNYSRTVTLSPGDGRKLVQVQLLDRAGNESELFASEVIVDTTPPLALADPAVSVRGATGLELTSLLVTLQFAVGGDSLLEIDGPVRMRYGVGAAPPEGTFGPFLPEASLLLSAGHGDVVSFYGVFEDAAGNRISLASPSYTVNLQGSVRGSVTIEGEPAYEVGGDHGGTLVRIYPAGAAIDGTSWLASAPTLADGSFAIANVPIGSYQVHISRSGAVPILRSPVSVAAGEATDIGAEQIVLARGDLEAVFLYGDKATNESHAGISVVAILDGRQLGSAVTDPTGLARLAGLPIGNTYQIIASATGYVAAEILGVEVRENQVMSAAAAATPLAKLAGDFKICDRDQAGVPKDCTAILYTNKDGALLGLEAQEVTAVRFIQQDPANPGEASFTNPAEPPTTQCLTPPAADCWNPYDANTHYIVPLGPTEGRLTVLVQFASQSTVHSVKSSSVVYDVTPPLLPAMQIARGPAALADGFTNSSELALTLSAVAGVVAGVETAPIALARVSRDDLWDGDGTLGDRQYTYGGTKLFQVAPSSSDATDGPRDVYAWFCDAAGNCSADADWVFDSIILDTQKPSRTRGRDILPSGLGVTSKGALREWWTRTIRYGVDIDVGTSPWGSPEVAAYRLSLSEQFVGAGWVQLDLPSIAPEQLIQTVGPELPPVDGDHVLWSQFMDAAGNVSDELIADRIALTLDTIPPGGTVTLEGGGEYTREPGPLLVELTTDVAGARIQTSWSGVLPDPYLPPADPDAPRPFVSSSRMAAPGSDGAKSLLVRFFDEAGNFAERQDTVIVDRTPPDALTAIAECDDCGFDASGAAFSKDRDVILYLYATDNSGFIRDIEVEVDGDPTYVVRQRFVPFLGVTLPAAEIPHSLLVTFIDPAGNTLTLPPFFVTLDQTPPSLTLLLNNDAVWTRAFTVSASLDATDASDIVGMYLSSSVTFSDASLRPFATPVEWVVSAPATDGQKFVYAKVIDAAGNEGVDDDFIFLDATPPSGSIAVVGGPYSQSASVQLALTRSDTGVVDMAYAESAPDCATATYSAFVAAPAAPLVLSAGDGSKTIHLCLRDSAGNTFAASTSVILDTVPPTGAFSINDGAAYTLSNVVDLRIAADPDVAEMKVANGSIDCSAAGYAPFQSAVDNHNLAAAEGQQSVKVCLRDAAGHSTELSGDIFLDLVNPAPTVVEGTLTGIVINAGDPAFTRSAQVSLVLGAADSATGSGVDMMKISDGTSCSGGTWQSYAPSLLWTLEAADATSRSLSVSFRDRAGRESACRSDSITVDTVPPAVTGFSVYDPAGVNTEYSRDAAVTAVVSYSGGCDSAAADGIQLSEDPAFGAGVQSYACGQLWPAGYTLAGTATDGIKVVYARVRDAAGNVSTAVADTVVLDTDNVGGAGVLINSGAAWTRSLGLSLALAASGATEMRLFANGSCTVGTPAESWEPLTSTATLAHPGPDAGGKLWVSAQFRDDAGNGATDCWSDDIDYDGSWSGGGSLVVNSGQQYTTNAQVTLTLTAGESTGVEMRLSNDDGCVTGSWESFPASGSQSWTLAGPGDAVQRWVSVRYRDRAGNESGCYRDDIIVDTVAPGVAVVIDDGALYTRSSVPEVTLSISGSGIAQVQASESPSFSGAQWQALAAVNPFALSAPNGVKVIYVRAQDAAGNVSSAVAADDILLDNQAPTGSLAVNGGASYATDAAGSVTLGLSAGDNLSGVANVTYEKSVDNSTWTGAQTVAFQPTLTVTLSSAASVDDALRYVRVTYTDAAGNSSAAYAQSIRLDNVTPVPGPAPIRIESGDPSTTSRDVTLALDVSPAAGTLMQISNGQGCLGSGAWQVFEAAPAWTLDGGGDGVLKYVSVRFRDAAGNTTSCAEDSISIDDVPPSQLSLSIDNGAEYTTSSAAQVSVIVSGIGISQVLVSESPAFTAAVWESPADVNPFQLAGTPAANGQKTIYAKARDAAGNETASVALDRIILDNEAPVGSVVIDEDAAYTIDAGGDVTLSLTASDNLSGVATVEFCTSDDGSTWGSCQSVAYVPTVDITLSSPSANGVARYVRAIFTDRAGTSSAPYTDSILLDNSAPAPGAPAIRINGTDTHTRSQAVTLTLSASPPAGLKMQLSNGQGCLSGSDWLDYATTYAWTLDGTGDSVLKYVSVRFKDQAGNVTACQDDSITIDTNAPSLLQAELDGRYGGTGGAPIGSDRGDTGDCYVMLDKVTVSGVYSAIQLSLAVDFASPFQTVPSTQSYPYYGVLLPASTCAGAATNGSKEIFIRAVDAAGNASNAIMGSVYYDTVAPVFTSTSIAGGADYTKSESFAMSVAASDDGGIVTVRMDDFHDPAGDNDDDVCSAPFRTFAWNAAGSFTYPHPVVAGDGARTVYVCLEDGAGNKTLDDNVAADLGAWDSIYLDKSAPTGLGLEVYSYVAGTTYSGGTPEGLRCGDGVLDPDPTPDEPHWVNAQFLEDVRPAASDAGSGLSEMRIAQDNNFNANPWRAFSTSATANLGGADGPKMLGLEVKDSLGTSAQLQNAVCVTLDRAPPDDVVLGAPTFASTPTVEVTLGAFDFQSQSQGMQFCFYSGSAIDTDGIRRFDGTLVGNAGDCFSSSSVWYDFSPPETLRLSLTAGEGDKPLTLYVSDAAGNVAFPAVETSIYYDTTAPAAPQLNVVQAGNKSAHLYWSAVDDLGSGLNRYEIVFREVQPASGQEYVVEVSPALTDYEVSNLDTTVPAAGGEFLSNRRRYSFGVRAVDNAGRASSSANPTEVAVGWQRLDAAFSNTNPIIPFGVEEYGGVIYVGYLLYDVVWGQSATTMHLATSSDGGQSWRKSSIDDEICISRETASLQVGPSGVVVVAAADTDPIDGPSNSRPRLARWLSTDQGISWQRDILDPAGCGDQACTAGLETCISCPQDCPMCSTELRCGDGQCSSYIGEEYGNCPADCPWPGGNCGNSSCEGWFGEGCISCPGDCPTCASWPYCGDNVCTPSMGEETSCPQDCYADDAWGPIQPQSGVTLTTDGGALVALYSRYALGSDIAMVRSSDGGLTWTAPVRTYKPPPSVSGCGNSICDPGENCWSCNIDCGGCLPTPYCGDYQCQYWAGESCTGCPNDCGGCWMPETVTCGNGSCQTFGGESSLNCPVDCGAPPPTCGTNGCEYWVGEWCGTCPGDCGPCGTWPYCGNSVCDGGMECSNCDADCDTSSPACAPQPYCGDSICDSGGSQPESAVNCPADCASASPPPAPAPPPQWFTPRHIAACNAQFNVMWTMLDWSAAYLMHSSTLGYQSTWKETVSERCAGSNCTGVNVQSAAVGCVDPREGYASFGAAFAVMTTADDSVQQLIMRSSMDTGGGGWDGADRVLRASGVDTLSRPAMYAAGVGDRPQLFISYRDGEGDVWVGETTDPLTDASWVWVESDKGSDAGVNLVMSGTGEGSPLLAYTDSTGHQLLVLRSAMPAPVLRAQVGSALSMSWLAMPSANGYQLAYGPNPTAVSATINTPSPSYLTSSIAQPYVWRVSALDAWGQSGEPGLAWELGRFTESTAAAGTSNWPMASSTGGLAVVDDTVLALIPAGFNGAALVNCANPADVCVYYSSNQGATFDDRLVLDNPTTRHVPRHMAIGPAEGGTDKRLHVVFGDAQANEPDLLYGWLDSTTSPPYLLGGTVVLDDTDTSNSWNVTGTGVQVSAGGWDGREVLVVWTEEQQTTYSDGITPTNRNIRYKYSSDWGRSWSPSGVQDGIRHYANAVNANVDLGHVPRNLTIVAHGQEGACFGFSGQQAYLAWNDDAQALFSAYSSNYTAGGWSGPYRVSAPGHEIRSMRGACSGDSAVIAWIGRRSASDTDPTINLYVSGYGWWNNNSSEQWANFQLDTENPVNENSLAIYHDTSGVYVVYATRRTTFNLTTRQLKLAYCRQECAGRDNWYVTVLQTDSDASFWNDDYWGITMDVDSTDHDIFVGASRQNSSGGRYSIQGGGRYTRRR